MRRFGTTFISTIGRCCASVGSEEIKFHIPQPHVVVPCFRRPQTKADFHDMVYDAPQVETSEDALVLLSILKSAHRRMKIHGPGHAAKFRRTAMESLRRFPIGLSAADSPTWLSNESASSLLGLCAICEFEEISAPAFRCAVDWATQNAQTMSSASLVHTFDSATRMSNPAPGKGDDWNRESLWASRELIGQLAQLLFTEDRVSALNSRQLGVALTCVSRLQSQSSGKDFFGVPFDEMWSLLEAAVKKTLEDAPEENFDEEVRDENASLEIDARDDQPKRKVDELHYQQASSFLLEFVKSRPTSNVVEHLSEICLNHCRNRTFHVGHLGSFATSMQRLSFQCQVALSAISKQQSLGPSASQQLDSILARVQICDQGLSAILDQASTELEYFQPLDFPVTFAAIARLFHSIDACMPLIAQIRSQWPTSVSEEWNSVSSSSSSRDTLFEIHSLFDAGMKAVIEFAQTAYGGKELVMLARAFESIGLNPADFYEVVKWRLIDRRSLGQRTPTADGQVSTRKRCNRGHDPRYATWHPREVAMLLGNLLRGGWLPDQHFLTTVHTLVYAILVDQPTFTVEECSHVSMCFSLLPRAEGIYEKLQSGLVDKHLIAHPVDPGSAARFLIACLQYDQDQITNDRVNIFSKLIDLIPEGSEKTIALPISLKLLSLLPKSLFAESGKPLQRLGSICQKLLEAIPEKLADVSSCALAVNALSNLSPEPIAIGTTQLTYKNLSADQRAAAREFRLAQKSHILEAAREIIIQEASKRFVESGLTLNTLPFLPFVEAPSERTVLQFLAQCSRFGTLARSVDCFARSPTLRPFVIKWINNNNTIWFTRAKSGGRLRDILLFVIVCGELGVVHGTEIAQDLKAIFDETTHEPTNLSALESFALRLSAVDNSINLLVPTLKPLSAACDAAARLLFQEVRRAMLRGMRRQLNAVHTICTLLARVSPDWSVLIGSRSHDYLDQGTIEQLSQFAIFTLNSTKFLLPQVALDVLSAVNRRVEEIPSPLLAAIVCSTCHIGPTVPHWFLDCTSAAAFELSQSQLGIEADLNSPVGAGQMEISFETHRVRALSWSDLVPVLTKSRTPHLEAFSKTALVPLALSPLTLSELTSLTRSMSQVDLEVSSDIELDVLLLWKTLLDRLDSVAWNTPNEGCHLVDAVYHLWVRLGGENSELRSPMEPAAAVQSLTSWIETTQEWEGQSRLRTEIVEQLRARARGALRLLLDRLTEGDGALIVAQRWSSRQCSPALLCDLLTRFISTRRSEQDHSLQPSQKAPSLSPANVRGLIVSFCQSNIVGDARLEQICAALAALVQTKRSLGGTSRFTKGLHDRVTISLISEPELEYQVNLLFDKAFELVPNATPNDIHSLCKVLGHPEVNCRDSTMSLLCRISAHVNQHPFRYNSSVHIAVASGLAERGALEGRSLNVFKDKLKMLLSRTTAPCEETEYDYDPIFNGHTVVLDLNHEPVVRTRYKLKHGIDGGEFSQQLAKSAMRGVIDACRHQSLKPFMLRLLRSETDTPTFLKVVGALEECEGEYASEAIIINKRDLLQ